MLVTTSFFRAEEQKSRRAEEQKSRRAEEQKSRRAEEQKNRRAEEQKSRRAEEQKSRRAEEQKSKGEQEEQRQIPPFRVERERTPFFKGGLSLGSAALDVFSPFENFSKGEKTKKSTDPL